MSTVRAAESLKDQYYFMFREPVFASFFVTTTKLMLSAIRNVKGSLHSLIYRLVVCESPACSVADCFLIPFVVACSVVDCFSPPFVVACSVVDCFLLSCFDCCLLSLAVADCLLLSCFG